MTKPSFILVDGSSYLFRAFHALPPLTNSHGQPTGAVYGVINMLNKLIKDYAPEYIAVVFDPKGKTFRDDLYPEYKANREIMPDDLQVQIRPLFDIINAMGLPLVIVDGVEADDVIGTLAQQAMAQGMQTLISTGDKDMAQLVNPQVTLINTMTGVILDPEGVKQKFGILPERMIDYLTLVGDSVDNVPGVPKVGPKTAVKWLMEYGSLDNVIKNAGEIGGKVGENLRDSLSYLPLTKQLVTIKCDVELPQTPQTLKPQIADKNKLIELFKQLEFKTWLKNLLEENSGNTKLAELDYEIILTQRDFDKWLQRLQQAELIAFDTETTDLNYIEAKIVGMSFAVKPGQAAYLPFGHDYMGVPKQLTEQAVFAAMKPLLEDPNKKILGHNLKYDMNVLANYAIQLQGCEFDSMLESYVADSTNRHDLDNLALKYLGHKTIHFEDVAGKGAKQITFNQVALEQAGPYAAEDADISLRLHQTLWPKISEHPGLTKTFTEIEMPLMPVLSKMERNGVLIDAKKLTQQSHVIGKKLEELEQEAFSIAGEDFNLSSPKQLQAILFDKLGLPVLEKTPTGQPSTAENVLQELAHEYPLPKVILEYRSLSKLKSTYTDKLPLQIQAKTGRVHSSFHQAVTATGRLSSSDPNLQNIPARTEEGRKIRQAFIAPPGYKIAALDYSQIELRIMADLSGDASLKKAFAEGKDIHQATAAEVFGMPLDKVTAEQRRSAKAINFGLIYGMSAFGLAKQLDIDKKYAQAYVDLYFSRYPGVRKYMDETRKKAHREGFVETLYGRRLYLPEINSRNKMRQMAAERTAINAPMQGTAADIIKRAMIRVNEWIEQHNPKVKMIMQVHDELVFEVPEADLKNVVPAIEKCMTTIKIIDTAISVGIGIGDNWDEAH